MAQHQRTDQLLLAALHILGERDDRQRSGEALVATARIAHHRDHRPIHAGIAGGCRHRQHVGIDRIAQEPLAKLPREGLAHGVAIATGLHRSLGSCLVHPGRLQDETDLLQGHLHSEVIDQSEVEGDLLVSLQLLMARS